MKCEGFGGPPGSSNECPYPRLKPKWSQGDLWLCTHCEEKRFCGPIGAKNKEANASFKINDVVFAKSTKTYPPWPAIIKDKLVNNSDYLVEFLGTKNVLLVNKEKVFKYEDNIATFRNEAHKTAHKDLFETAMIESSSYGANSNQIEAHAQETNGALYPDLTNIETACEDENTKETGPIIVNTPLALCRLLSMNQTKENSVHFLAKLDFLGLQEWRHASCLLGNKNKENKNKISTIIGEILDFLYVDTSSEFTVEFKHLHLIPLLTPSAIEIAINYGLGESYCSAALDIIKSSQLNLTNEANNTVNLTSDNTVLPTHMDTVSKDSLSTMTYAKALNINTVNIS